MVSKIGLEQFINKNVFVRIIDEERVQVGILKKRGEDFFIESDTKITLVDPLQIARITVEGEGRAR